MKTAVIYWSGTGNTKMMADAIFEGMKSAGADAQILTSAAVDSVDLSAIDAIAFGCPAMGAEVLEEDEFDPMFQACKGKLAEKRIALFGSYGWGDGEWMRLWEKDCADSGISLYSESLMCVETPDDAVLESCRSFGKKLAE